MTAADGGCPAQAPREANPKSEARNPRQREDKSQTWEEARALRSQIATLDAATAEAQTAASMRGRHAKYLPYAFSEHGAVMVATILNSPRAIEVSVFVVRAFVKLSRIAADQRQFALKLAELENKLAAHDKNFQAVFAAIRQLMQPPAVPKRRKIGFVTGPDDATVRDRARSKHQTRSPKS